MKNPLEKKTPAGLIAGIVIGSVVAAEPAYLFFTGDGRAGLGS